MRIVVVGGTGNVGTALLRAVRSPGPVTQLDVVSRRGPGRLASRGGAPGAGTPRSAVVQHHRLDVAAAAPGSPEGERLVALLRGADAVVHLAWAHQPSHDAATLRRTNRRGTAAVLGAAARSGVPHVVVASSHAAYAPADDDAPRDESWPVTGIPGSAVSADKVAVENMLEAFAARHHDTTVTSLRPAITLQESVGAAFVRAFLGFGVPRFGLRDGHLPALVWPEGLRIQVVHADDVAAAYLAAVERRMPGPFNVAAPQVLRGADVADALGAERLVELPLEVARVGHTLAWHARLVPAAPDWLDTLAHTPVLDSQRAQQRLAWRAVRSGADVLREAAAGIAVRREGWTPPLTRSGEA
ncbi:NAD-dependent epimerase/dehydratase family protein [Beutenbergia cavernae]|nr:NAD-dependent epimerase/dehydratase family protein [Beutenbergia cavernae]